MQPDYAKNENRSIKPEIMVMVGICTHLGCSPSSSSKKGSRRHVGTGSVAFCARATVRPSISPAASKAKPAPDNLEVPPHYYIADGQAS